MQTEYLNSLLIEIRLIFSFLIKEFKAGTQARHLTSQLLNFVKLVSSATHTSPTYSRIFFKSCDALFLHVTNNYIFAVKENEN